MKKPVPDATAAGVAASNSSGELFSQLYTRLRHLAAQKLAQEKPGQTLQATALVHEAWLRLVREEDRTWNDPQHFFCAAATAMRRILIENARRKKCPKHGGQLHRVDVADSDIVCALPDDQLLALDEALDRLASVNPRAAEVVQLRFFAGLTEAQMAVELGISATTVERTWAFARAWLFNEIRQDLKNPADVKENAPENRL